MEMYPKSDHDVLVVPGGETWKAMLDAAASAYEFGVFPGDESEATEDEIREMAERVVRAALGAVPVDERTFGRVQGRLISD